MNEPNHLNQWKTNNPQTTAALTHSAVTSAAPAQNCPATDVCYSVGVPSSSASSGSGNIYIQLRAPTSYAWVGIGQGSQMAGANMFLIYADGAGNVTVSPRSGLGHVEPQENADADVEVLAGTGVESGAMVANFRCGSCGGAEMDLASTSAGWIAAWEQGDAIDSLDRNAQIVKHDSYDISQIDLTQATITSDSNPYVTSGDGGNSGSGSGSSGDSGDSSSGGGTVTTPGAVVPGGAGDTASFAKIGKIIMAHWVVMLVVWVILFPLGSALMPLFGKWVLHAAWQSVAFILMWAGFGLGYVASQQIGLVSLNKHHHSSPSYSSIYRCSIFKVDISHIATNLQNRASKPRTPPSAQSSCASWPCSPSAAGCTTATTSSTGAAAPSPTCTSGTGVR